MLETSSDVSTDDDEVRNAFVGSAGGSLQRECQRGLYQQRHGGHRELRAS